MPDVSSLFVGVDLDYTLFDTDNFFYGAVLPLLIHTFPQMGTNESFKSQMEQYRQSHGPATSYDLFHHLQDLKIDTSAAEELIRTTVSGNQYLLPGAEAFIHLQQQRRHNLQIITVGGMRFQTLKIQAVPALEGIESHIIQESKGHFIAHSFPKAHGYMLDDTKIEGLPDTISQLHIQSHKSNHGSEAFQYDSLLQVLEQGPAELLK